MDQVALIFIYNHQYNANIEILEKIYSHRFSNIFHLVPFYEGEKENVIPVYENSFYFEGYIAQGFKFFFNKKFKHYIFLADDLVIHPKINQNNYQEHFKLKQDSCFISDLIELSDVKSYWNWMIKAYTFELKGQGVEAEKQLPAYSEALNIFHKKGFDFKGSVGERECVAFERNGHGVLFEAVGLVGLCELEAKGECGLASRL